MPEHRYGRAALLWFGSESMACPDACAGMVFSKADLTCSHWQVTQACAGSDRVGSSYPRPWLSICRILPEETRSDSVTQYTNTWRTKLLLCMGLNCRPERGPR